MNTLGERIKVVRRSINATQGGFASLLGISQKMVTTYESDAVIPKVDILAGIVDLLPEGDPRDLEWLIRGEGFSRKKSLFKEPVKQWPDGDKGKTPQGNYVYLPLYDVRASMGVGAFNDTEYVVGERAFNQAWLQSENLKKESLALIQAEGDSMEPTLSDGDTLLIDHSITKVKSEAIYVLRIGETLVAKRLQMLFDGSVSVQCDNPRYQDYTISASEVETSLTVVGRVVWVGRRL